MTIVRSLNSRSPALVALALALPLALAGLLAAAAPDDPPALATAAPDDPPTLAPTAPDDPPALATAAPDDPPAPGAAVADLGFGPGALVQLAVADLDRAVAFYRDVLGLHMKERNDALAWAKFQTALPGLTIGVGEAEAVTGSGTTSLNLTVADTDAARALLESRGVTFLRPTTDIPGVVRLADFRDPDGNLIRLAGPSRD